jgi:hypothetical protein
MAMVLGGNPHVFSCLKHIGHCCALHSNKLTLPLARDTAFTILAIDNIWIFTRLKAVVGAVFELEGCGPVTKLQAAVGARLKERHPKLYKAVQLRYNIENAAVSSWSKDGFRHNGMIQVSPKIRNVVFKLNDPGYILGTAMQAFFHKMVHGVLLSKSLHLKESSSLAMGGVASVPKRVLFFLRRLMWLVVPLPKGPRAQNVLKAVEVWKAVPGVLYKGKGEKNDCPWEMHYILQYKGAVSAKPGRGSVVHRRAGQHHTVMDYHL